MQMPPFYLDTAAAAAAGGGGEPKGQCLVLLQRAGCLSCCGSFKTQKE